MTAAQRIEMAARLKAARETRGLTQEEVALALKLSRPAVSLIESGARKVEALELEQMAKLYGRAVSYFLVGDPPPTDLVVAQIACALRKMKPEDVDAVLRFVDGLRAGGTPPAPPASTAG